MGTKNECLNSTLHGFSLFVNLRSGSNEGLSTGTYFI